MDTSLSVYIVGAGAIGKVLAVFLKKKGLDVTLVRATVASQEKSQQLITVSIGQSIFQECLFIVSLDHIIEQRALLILTNKALGNEQLASALCNKFRSSHLVLMQNGLGVEDAFIKERFANLFRTVLFATSQPVGDNHFHFKPVAPSIVGLVAGNSVDLINLISILDTPFFRFGAELNIKPVIWEKVIINTVFNSVCPLIECDNGIFHRNDLAKELARKLINQGVAIARTQEVLLNSDKVFETLLKISKASEGQLISTYQDINAGRDTEIQYLNFALAEQEKTRSDLTSEILLLGELIRIKSAIAKHKK